MLSNLIQYVNGTLYLKYNPAIGGISLLWIELLSTSIAWVYFIMGTSYNPNKKQHTKLYHAWYSMKHRCTFPHSQWYHRYGGRGITVCNEWLYSFECFKKWALANGFSLKLSLDRIDNDGNYEPSNCRWVTQQVQANNNSQHPNNGVIKIITYNGESLSSNDWSNRLGGNINLVKQRLQRGWPLKRALTEMAKK